MRHRESVGYQMPLAPCHQSMTESLEKVVHIPVSKINGCGISIPVPEKAAEGYFRDLDERFFG
jgi:hypothetical protein